MYRETPVHLATGEDTHVYLDVKGVVHDGKGLLIAAKAMLEHLGNLAHEGTIPNVSTAIGGPTMGADVLSHTICILAEQYVPSDTNNWFSIRDKVKADHGMGKRIEGYDLGPNDQVIITDDVANSGKSLVEAVQYVRETGAEVSAVVPLVDRSDKTAALMAELGVPYFPLLTSEDLGLEPLK